MKVSKKEVVADFNLFKNKAIHECKTGNYQKAALYSSLAAKIGYNFNFKFADNELEDCIISIGSSIIKKNIAFTGIQNRIVFHDSFAIDNRGLTQQYLRAIFSWNFELLYITDSKKIGQQIVSELNNYSKAQVLLLTEDSLEKNLLKANDAINRFKPEKALLHFSPWDIFGIALWSQINSAERFLINLTDHAFWLGKSCIDYSIEFRNAGAHLSQTLRGLTNDKLLFQPYYPIISYSEFKGFPAIVKNKTIAFAGASYYKVYGYNFLLLKMIKDVLVKNPNLVFLFAGSGDEKPIKKFIKDNNIENSFFLIGNRSDISEVFKNIDIYVNTYPMIGGLMSQYAAIMNKPIIGYCDENLFSLNNTEDLLGIVNRRLLIKTTKESFIEYFNELVNKIEIRKENIEFTKNSVLTPSEFNQSLKKTIEEKVKYPVKYEEGIDQVRFFETYLDIENNFLKNYNNIIFSNLGINMIYFKPHRLIMHLIKKLLIKLNLIN